MNSELATNRFNDIISRFKSNFPELRHVNLKLIDKSKSLMASTNVENNGKVGIYLPMFFGYSDKNESVSAYEFVESVIAYYHESHHALQFLQKKKHEYDDMYSQLESYVSRNYNSETYMKNYHLFSYEIEAERFALYKSNAVLIEVFNGATLNSIMLDYVKARIDQDSDNYKYFIDGPVTDMLSVFDKFDEAYEKSYQRKKDFESYETDCVGKVLKQDATLRRGFRNSTDGFEQTYFAACIVLQEHPELYKSFKVLKKFEYDVQDIRDASVRNDDLCVDIAEDDLNMERT